MASVIELWHTRQARARRSRSFVLVERGKLLAVADLSPIGGELIVLADAGKTVASLSGSPPVDPTHGAVPYRAAGGGYGVVWASRDASGLYVVVASTDVDPIARVLDFGLERDVAHALVRRTAGIAR